MRYRFHSPLRHGSALRLFGSGFAAGWVLLLTLGLLRPEPLPDDRTSDEFSDAHNNGFTVGCILCVSALFFGFVGTLVTCLGN